MTLYDILIGAGIAFMVVAAIIGGLVIQGWLTARKKRRRRL